MTIDIEQALDRAESSLAEGRGLAGTGFWKAVGVARRDRQVAERYADRMAVIDRRAFEAGVKARVPLWAGVLALSIGTVVGLLAVLISLGAADISSSNMLMRTRSFDPSRFRAFVPLSFLFGFGALIVCTHSLAHYVVGRAYGIRFTHVFLGGPPPPRPGVKTDYATYLRASKTGRVMMHASGAVVTKIVPFALAAVAAPLYGRWPWLVWLMILVGVGQIITDITLSTKSSDWKKVKREFRS